MTMEKIGEKEELDALVRQAVLAVQEGKVGFGDVLQVLAPKPQIEPVPETLPIPKSITEDQNRAIDRIREVFGKVIPTVRRTLAPDEVTKLLDEKETLDQLKKMAESRHEDIRTTIFNHLDVEAEETGIPEGTFKGRSGHWVMGGEVRGESDSPSKFTREVRHTAPSLNLGMLEALVDDPDVEFDRKDFLAMTDQVRVVNEHKVMIALKKNPKLIHAIAQAINPGSRTASLNVRKA